MDNDIINEIQQILKHRYEMLKKIKETPKSIENFNEYLNLLNEERELSINLFGRQYTKGLSKNENGSENVG